MESIETKIVITTHNPKKAEKFKTKKEKEGFKYEGMNVCSPQNYLPTYVMEFSKLEQFK